jgi:hypothetical protein
MKGKSNEKGDFYWMQSNEDDQSTFSSVGLAILMKFLLNGVGIWKYGQKTSP